jgi:hypothetical protein
VNGKGGGIPTVLPGVVALPGGGLAPSETDGGPDIAALAAARETALIIRVMTFEM